MHFFVKRDAAADEKGPYTIDSLRAAHAKGVLTERALVREESGEEWRTLFELLRGAKKRDARLPTAKELDTKPGHGAPGTWPRQSRLLVGAVMLTFGVALTWLSKEAGVGIMVVFGGLIGGGLYHIVRALRG